MRALRNSPVRNAGGTVCVMMQILAPRGCRYRMAREGLPPIDALSPVDGRYRKATEPLRALLSEAGLIRERVRIEAQWLLHLAQAVPGLAGGALVPAVRERAEEMTREPAAEAAGAVKRIEER